MTKSGVYKITNTTNGKFYIGSSKDIEQRFDEHKRKLKNNNHVNPILQNSWNYYGEDKFTFEVLEECENCAEREQYYLDTFQPYKGTGYNINPMATGGDPFTYNPNKELIREKMKLVNGGENNGMFGKTHDENSVLKMKTKAKGRYSLEWFIERYGEEGNKKFQERRQFLSNRKINYSYDNGLKGKKVKVEKTRGSSVSNGRKALKDKKEEWEKDIKRGLFTMNELSKKYGVSINTVKYHKKKLQ